MRDAAHQLSRLIRNSYYSVLIPHVRCTSRDFFATLGSAGPCKKYAIPAGAKVKDFLYFCRCII